MTDFDGVLRPRSDGGEEAYLPTPTVQCHAANLAILPDGDLACVWFGGTQEGVADISVHLSRLPRGTSQWLDPVQLSFDSTRSEQNPILFTAPDGDVWLLYTGQVAGNQDTSEVRLRVSHDAGRTWDEPRPLLGEDAPAGVFVRQTPVALEGGRILLPTFNCLTRPGEKWVGDHDTASVWYSDDDGASWTEVQVPGSEGCVHMNIVPRTDGTLWACFRSRWADHVYESESSDGGLTWSPCRPLPLPNNNSSIQARAKGEGTVAMVMNWASRADATARRTSLYDEIDEEGLKDPGSDGTRSEATGSKEAEEAGSPEPGASSPEPVAAAGDADGAQAAAGPVSAGGPAPAEPAAPPERARTAFWGAPRAPMTLLLSEDDGRTWEVAYDVENGDGYCLTNNSRDGLNRELSYPSVLWGPDGEIHLAYTWKRRTIKHVRLGGEVVERIRAERPVSAGPEPGPSRAR